MNPANRHEDEEELTQFKGSIQSKLQNLARSEKESKIYEVNI